MRKRESLKDLQTRLADRLQVAQSSDAPMAWLAVTVGAGNYLLPLRQSGEILPITQLHPVPRTQSWFMGVVNIRGSLFGTVDLGQFIAKTTPSQVQAPSRASQAEEENITFVTLNPLLEVNCALQVSGLTGLRANESFRSAMPPRDDAPAYFRQQFQDAEGKLWQEIDLQILSHSPQFLNISA
jgi:twitching motility protein PilI